MNNLILKARGVKNITRSEAIDISMPQKTDSYTPISNEQIINTSLEAFAKEGLKVKSELYKTDASRSKFVGGFTISSGNSEIDMFMGWKNSIDKSMSAAYGLGAQVFICSNSSVRAEQSLIRKHTGSADKIITIGLTEGIKRLGDNFRQIEKEFERMKEIEVSKKTYASLIGQLYLEQNIITAHQLAVIKGEMDVESYDYGVTDTLFNVYQAVTHSLKSAHPTYWLNSHLDAHKFFVNEAGILVENTPKIVVPVDEYHISPNQLSMFEEV